MKIINQEVLLNEDEAIFFGVVLSGMVQGLDQKRESGLYINKQERELYKRMAKILEELEENDII